MPSMSRCLTQRQLHKIGPVLHCHRTGLWTHAPCGGAWPISVFHCMQGARDVHLPAALHPEPVCSGSTGAGSGVCSRIGLHAQPSACSLHDARQLPASSTDALRADIPTVALRAACCTITKCRPQPSPLARTTPPPCCSPLRTTSQATTPCTPPVGVCGRVRQPAACEQFQVQGLRAHARLSCAHASERWHAARVILCVSCRLLWTAGPWQLRGPVTV